jgi:hypothetical protein
MALSPPPPCGKATKGRMIKAELVLDRPLAPCRGSGAALAVLSRQGRSDRSHFALPLTDLTGKQCRLPRSDCCATRQGEADSSRSPASGATGNFASPDLRARPPPQPRKVVSASPDPRARPQARPRKVVSASSDPRARPQPRPRKKSRPRPTPPSASGGVSASPDLGLGPTTPQGVHHCPTPS